MFRDLTAELLDLRSRTIGRSAQAFALTVDCCSSCCSSCWPYPLCIIGY
jgi:hypothetical protein